MKKRGSKTVDEEGSDDNWARLDKIENNVSELGAR